MNWKDYCDGQAKRLLVLRDNDTEMAELEITVRDYLGMWDIPLDSTCYGAYNVDVGTGKVSRKIWTWKTVDYYKLLKDFKGKVCNIMSSPTVITREFTFKQNGNEVIVHISAEIPAPVQAALRKGGVIVTKHTEADDYETVECPIEAPTVEGELTLIAGGSNEVTVVDGDQCDPEAPADTPVTLEHVERSEPPAQELLQRIQAVKDGDSATFETDQTQEVRHE